MGRFSFGFVTGLLTGLGIATIVMLWKKEPVPDALLTKAQPSPPHSQPEMGFSGELHAPDPPVESEGDRPAGDLPTATGSADTQAVTRTESQTVVPVPVHELLENMLRPQGKGDRSFNPIGPIHSKLESESDDPVWSHYVEWHLRDYLDRQPGVLSKQIEVFLVECRSTLCEIQALADVADRSPAADWQRIAARMENEAWWNEFSEMTTSVTARRQRASYVTFLFRKSTVPPSPAPR